MCRWAMDTVGNRQNDVFQVWQNSTRKPCCRNETARCCSYSFRFKVRHACTISLRVHNDLSRSSDIINFGTNRKRAYDFLLVLNSNLGPILPRFRDIRAMVHQKPLFFAPYSYFGENFGVCGVPLRVDPWCWGCKERTLKLTNGEILFEDFQPIWSRYLNVTDGRTDRQTTCRSNTARKNTTKWR